MNRHEAPLGPSGLRTSAIRSAETNLEGLKALAEALREGPLAENFDKATQKILETKGRLIVVGVGKSGHIGAKLAATFASTGTPAFFVHPTEASHGDLGMIRREDVILMLSWSGETKELGDIIAYSRRFGVQLIALTGKEGSMLDRAADISLVLPRAAEACPHNLAPTTSTLLQLAIGDALAIALLEARGFTAERFRDFHPGGKLGASLKPVSAIMMRGELMPLATPEASVLDAINIITSRGMGIVGVLEPSGRLAGVITDGDVRRHLERSASDTMRQALLETPAARIMTQSPITVAPDILAATALRTMEAEKITAVFVIDQGTPVGILTFLHLLQIGVA